MRIKLFGKNGKFGSAIASLAPPDLLVDDDIDLFIDASLPIALAQNLQAALTANRPIVIGTTGHTSLEPIRLASAQIPIFYAPNFSLGMALLHRLAAEAARRFPADIDLIETHHTQKRDAPSGSAKSLAEAINQKVAIHSIRSGATIGTHQLLFNTPEEQITLTHTAHSRSAFARGAIAAARFLLTQPPGLYSMDHLLNCL